MGDDGQLYLAGMQESCELAVVWGEGAESRCEAKVKTPSQAKGMTALSATCS